MSNEFDERKEVIEKEEGYYWHISIQIGSASERVKAKTGGNETSKDAAIGNAAIALQGLEDEARKAHDNLTEEE